MTRTIGVSGTEQTKCAKRKPKIKKGGSEEVMEKLGNNPMKWH